MTSNRVRKALFRLDSGEKYGLGHITRSKALADALYKNGMACTFAVKTVHQNDAVNPHRLLFIDNEDEFLFLAKNYDCVIIDHYDYTSEQLHALSKLEQSTLVVLDDECNRGDLYADIIINPVNQAIFLSYEDIAPKAKLLLGSDYILLRQAFTQVKCQNFGDRESIIITFGGSDMTELTLPVLKIIKNSSLIDFNIIVVTGAACQKSDEIKSYCQKNGFQYQYNVKNMADLFAKAKLAISAAGSTAFELACCGVPAVFAVIADNQLMSIKEQCSNGWCAMVDCRVKNKAEELLQKAEQMLYSSQLESLSQTAQSLIDGQGADRVATQIKRKYSVTPSHV